MAALVVLAHPLSNSLSHRLAATTMAALNNDARLLDLYSEAFDPVLTRSEREGYYRDATPQQGHAALLTEVETLVLVFPTWWFGPPAILKGWIDRVFAPGIAFGHAPNGGPIVPRLDRLRRALVVTTLGTPWWVDRLVMRRPLRRIMKTAIIGACAPQARFQYLALYSAENIAENRVAAFEQKLQASLSL